MQPEGNDHALQLYTYKLAHDAGFATNPFWSVLTLASSRPMRVQRRAEEWIAGFTSSTQCSDAVGQERLVYLMKVAHRPTIAEHFGDVARSGKIPDLEPTGWVGRMGSSVSRPNRELVSDCGDLTLPPPALHADLCGSGVADQPREEVSRQHVLVAKLFVYFGGRPLPIPASLRPRLPKRQSPYGVLTRDSRLAARFIAHVLAQAGEQCV